MWIEGPGNFTVADESETVSVSLPDGGEGGQSHKSELAAALKIIRSLGYRVLTVLPPRPYLDDEQKQGEIYLIVTELIAEAVKPEKLPLTTEERNALRREIFELIAEMKGPPFIDGAAMREGELQLRKLHICLSDYYSHVQVASGDSEVADDYPPDAMPLG